MTKIEAYVWRPLLEEVRDSLLSSEIPLANLSVGDVPEGTEEEENDVAIISTIVPDEEVTDIFTAFMRGVSRVQRGKSRIVITKLPPEDDPGAGQA